MRGIQRILHCYYNGICSWAWFYPYHYAPFASDFINIGAASLAITNNLRNERKIFTKKKSIQVT